MLKIIAAIVVLLWGLGWATSSTLGGFFHALVVLAVVLFVIETLRALQARERDAGGNRTGTLPYPIAPLMERNGPREPYNEEALTVWEGEGGRVSAAGTE